MNIVYNIHDGDIVSIIQDDQDYKVYFESAPIEYQENLSVMYIKKEDIPNNISHYKVESKKIISRNALEISEKEIYGKILTKEKRLVERLMPSYEEISKSKSTIEILNLIQDVGLIGLADTALIDAKLIDAYASLTLSGSSILNESDRVGINQKLVPTKYKIEVNTKVTEKTNKEKK